MSRHTLPPDDKAVEIERRVVRADGIGTMYAYGRMDQGHPPVLGGNGSSPTPTDTAWAFGRLYAEQERAFAEGTSGHAYGVASAWDHFVASNGASIDSPRFAQQKES